MKILQIINSLGTGGAEKLLLDTIPLYRKEGIEMNVLLFWDNDHQFTQALKDLGCCKVIVLNESSNYKDIYSVTNIFKLRKYLKDYDLAHVHLFPSQYYTVLANFLNGNRCKLIFTEHNTTNRRIQNIFFKPIEKFIYNRYKKIVCISDEIKDIYSSYLPFFSGDLVKINNGVNLSVINESLPLQKNAIYEAISGKQKMILQVSAFRPQKDQQTLIKAISFLPKNIILILVGDGETRNECEKLTKEFDLTDRVFFLGQRMDVPQLLKTADVVVLSSKYEGLSLSSIEGMVSGKPFVASDVPGLSELVGGAGVLFECGNAEELAFKINELLNNPDLYQKVAKACNERAKQYGIRQMVDKHIELYKSVYKVKIIRTSTVAVSLDYLLKGQLKYLNLNFEVVAVSGKDKHLENVSKREGVRTLDLEMQRPISPFKDFISLWRLYRMFRQECPLIVHSITPKAGLLSMLAAKMAGVPVRMHTFTGLIFPSKTGFVKQLLIVMDKVLCHCATNIYPEGQGVRQDLIAYKITRKPLKVIANGNVNGIDIAYFDPELISREEKQSLKTNLGITPADFVFIFVGRLVGDKGINELITAFELFTTHNTQPITPKLLLVGPFESSLDPLQPETLRIMDTNKNIISVGFQKDVRPYFAISDCLVFPSYREGFPNVVMQAGAMGLPSIVTNINGCNEIIVEGENGIVIPVKNTEALGEAMRKMMEDHNFRTQLQQNARPMIVSRYEQQVVWEAILAEYKRLEKSNPDIQNKKPNIES